MSNQTNTLLKKIIILGPSIERTPGGIATVISSQLQSRPGDYGFKFEPVISHVEGNVFEKLNYFLKSAFILLTRRNLSLVHIHVASDASFYRKSLLAAICFLRNIPVIMHSHGADFDSFYLNSNRVSKRWIRYTFKSCKKVIVLSRYWFEFFTTHISSGNVETLYNGVEIPVANDPANSDDKSKNFLFLGRLGQRKGVYDLLEAIDILVNQFHKKDIRFFLAGDGEIEEVREIIKTKRLTGNVEILGWLSGKQKEEAFANISTIVLPSYNEGLPMALLEGMAAGKVIVSSRVGGIGELVEEGKNGYLINPGDIDMLVNHLLHLLHNPNEMETISKNNIQKIDEHYNLKKLNSKLFRIYSEALV